MRARSIRQWIKPTLAAGALSAGTPGAAAGIELEQAMRRGAQIDERRSALCAEMPACTSPDDVGNVEHSLAELCSPWGLGVGRVSVYLFGRPISEAVKDVGLDEKEKDEGWARRASENALRLAGVYSATSRARVGIHVERWTKEAGRGDYVEVTVHRPARIDYSSGWQGKEFWKLHKHLAEQHKEHWHQWGDPTKRTVSNLPAGPYATSVSLTAYKAYSPRTTGPWTTRVQAGLSEVIRIFTLAQQHPACVEFAGMVREFDSSGRTGGGTGSIKRLLEKYPEYTGVPDSEIATALMRSAGGAVTHMMERCGAGWPGRSVRCPDPIWAASAAKDAWFEPPPEALKATPEETLERLRKLVPVMQEWTDGAVTRAFAERFGDRIVGMKDRCGAAWPHERCKSTWTKKAR